MFVARLLALTCTMVLVQAAVGEARITGAVVARRQAAIDVIENATVFLFLQPMVGQSNRYPLATGFFLRIHSKTSKATLELLITARHVIEPKWADCHASPRTAPLFLRLNIPNFDPSTGQSGVTFEPLILIDPRGVRQYAVSSDPRADLAMIYLTPDNGPNLGNYGLTPLTLNSFATVAALTSMRAGDPVLAFGLVPGMPGRLRNLPMARSGVIAAIPTESIAMGVDCSGHPHAVQQWIVAMHADYGGSGGPVFLNTGPLPVLLGIQSSRIEAREGDLNSGYELAGVTPIKDLYAALVNLNIEDADLRTRDAAGAPPP